MIANALLRMERRMKILRLRPFWRDRWFYMLLIIATCFTLSVLRTEMFGHMPRLLYSFGGLSNAKRIYTEILGHNCLSVHTDPEHELQCGANFSTHLEDNIRKIMEYPSAHVKEYFHEEKLEVFRRRDLSAVLPVFTTAISSNHFEESMDSLESLSNTVLKVYPDVLLILYDIGLTREHIVKIKQNYPRIQIRRFPFEDYPKHVAYLRNFAWKVIIIQKILIEFGAVFWIDASIRFTRNNISDVFAHARKYGIAVWDNGLLFPSPSLTDPRMFKFFNEERCLFNTVGMVQAGAVVLYNTNVTFHAILKPWVACAMAKSCIAPEGSSFYGCRPADGATYRCCHRHDQSALTIIVNRLYQYGHKRDMYGPKPAYTVDRHAPSILHLDDIVKDLWKRGINT